MGTRVSRSIAGISIILGAAATANSASTDFNRHDFEDCRRVTESELNDMRGGFEINAGGMQLLLSLGIERVTYVNGVLVAMNSLNLLPEMNASQMQGLNSQIRTGITPQTTASLPPPAVAATTPTSVSVPFNPSSLTAPSPPPTTSASAVSNITTTAPAHTITLNTPNLPGAPITPGNTPSVVAPSTPVAVSPVSISLPNVSTPNSFQPVQLAQIGQSNTFTPPSVASLTSGIMTVVQNRLDNQVIQNMTIINATLANQDLIRSMAINAALNRISTSLSR